MNRIFLFLATNFAVMMVITIISSVFGLDHYLTEYGIDYKALAIFSLLWGSVGSIIALFMSKSAAKRSMGVEVIEHPSNDREEWLVNTVKRQAQSAGIGMPEVGIFQSDGPNAFATGANRNNALVAVSSGLLDKMTREEAEAVMGACY
jgi:heat shock protein HtpX